MQSSCITFPVFSYIPQDASDCKLSACIPPFCRSPLSAPNCSFSFAKQSPPTKQSLSSAPGVSPYTTSIVKYHPTPRRHGLGTSQLPQHPTTSSSSIPLCSRASGTLFNVPYSIQSGYTFTSTPRNPRPRRPHKAGKAPDAGPRSARTMMLTRAPRRRRTRRRSRIGRRDCA